MIHSVADSHLAAARVPADAVRDGELAVLAGVAGAADEGAGELAVRGVDVDVVALLGTQPRNLPSSDTPTHSTHSVPGPQYTFGLGHSTTSEKSSPYLHQGMILTHMVPDLARWPNSLFCVK